jgi:hypothetical protein
MGRNWTGTLLLSGAWMLAQPAEAQFSGHAIYEIGSASTDVGEAQGTTSLAYGFGAGGSYSFSATKGIGLVVGADLLVRAFGVSLPGAVEQGAGVFDQSDLVVDEIVAVRLRRILAGLYLEQRRINRGTALGTIGFPASAIGFLADIPIGSGDRTGVRFSYAQFRSGRLQLQGSTVEPEIDSGRSIRVSGRHYFSERWGIRAEYTDIELLLEDIAPTFTFFDHRQKTVSIGALLSF